MITRIVFIVVAVSTTVLSGQSPATADWPQWRGADRTGLSRETGLLKQWPAAGPPVVWSAANLGAGYGSIADQRRPRLRAGHARLAEHRLRAQSGRWQGGLGARPGPGARPRSGTGAAQHADH